MYNLQIKDALANEQLEFPADIESKTHQSYKKNVHYMLTKVSYKTKAYAKTRTT